MEDTKENVFKKILKNKKVLIGISIAIVLILISIIIAIKFSNKKVEYKVEYEGTSNGIEYSSAMQANSEVYVLMKNKTGKAISGLNLIISYYDSEGKELARRTSSSDVYLKNENKIYFENFIAGALLKFEKLDNLDISLLLDDLVNANICEVSRYYYIDKLNGFMYIPKEGFELEYYTEMYVDCQDSYDIYEEDYEEFIEEITPVIEEEALNNAKERVEGLRQDIDEEYNEAIDQIEEEVKEQVREEFFASLYAQGFTNDMIWQMLEAGVIRTQASTLIL